MNAFNVSAGQTILSPRARTGLSRQMESPIYYPEYYQAELEVSALLQNLMGTQHPVYIITGNATHAIEATLVSVLQPGESILTVNSGIFGQVFTEVARIVGAIPVEFCVPYGTPVDLGQFERALQTHPEVKAVSLVHVETSTGVMQQLEGLARLIHKYGKLFILDAVSSQEPRE
jgi:aspartate aminotransferase-like enzyme